MSHRARVFRIDPADVPEGWTHVVGDAGNSDRVTRLSFRIHPATVREGSFIAHSNGIEWTGNDRRPGFVLFDDADRTPMGVPGHSILPRSWWCATLAEAATVAGEWEAAK